MKRGDLAFSLDELERRGGEREEKNRPLARHVPTLLFAERAAVEKKLTVLAKPDVNRAKRGKAPREGRDERGQRGRAAWSKRRKK